MKNIADFFTKLFKSFWNGLGLGMQSKLIITFLVVKIIPLLLLTVFAWSQIRVLGETLMQIAVDDSSEALNSSAVENIERMTTDTALKVAEFLYSRDEDILYLSNIEPSEKAYRAFIENMTGRVLTTGNWELADDGLSWVRTDSNEVEVYNGIKGVSTNSENDDNGGFHYRAPDDYIYENIPLYDEITFIDLEGNEVYKVVAGNSPKINYPLSPVKKNVSLKENTYVKAEDYFGKLKNMQPGEIYVSDVIGAYVGSNYIGMYVPEIVEKAAQTRGYEIEYDAVAQAYAGMENPVGQRFEGIVRWATPVADENGVKIGYVSFALNHDHIMEFVDHQTPMNERYTELPSAFEGNYAFIWDYKCRNICHPRHHSIAGYNPETGDPEIPWLESSIYDGWLESGEEKWMDFAKNLPLFDEQSRTKIPAPALTQAGLVGLDGRFLNTAPQCTGWMDLTVDGGSGSFYILWSGLYKLTTAAAIPYYTGQYAPSVENNHSLRGFGIVTIGAGLDDFAGPAVEMGTKLQATMDNSLLDVLIKLVVTAALLIIVVVMIAITIASFLTDSITTLIHGISLFSSGKRQFRFNSTVKDEFGTLADSFDDMADSIVDSVKTPLSIIDNFRRIIYVNDIGLSFSGATLEEAVGKPYKHFSIYPLDTEYCPITALEKGTEPEVYYNAQKDRYYKGEAMRFIGKDGKQIGYIISTTDLTDMTREQIKTEEQRIVLDKTFSASPDMIWYIDGNGRYITVNPRFAEIAGKEPREFVGNTAGVMLPSRIARQFIKNDKESIRLQEPVYTEESIEFADSHKEILDVVRMPVFDGVGHFVGLLGYARNVTARVKIESELRQTQLDLENAVNEANMANMHKGEFLARMSHEIRTPMNAIIGITGITLRKLDELEKGAGEIGEVKSHVLQIESSSQHLLSLLNDILDISKIEAGKIELVDEVIEIDKLAYTVAGIIAPRCAEKNIKFITNFDDFEPSTFLSDSLRLRQVLINLLGNSVKFTPDNGIIEFSILKKDHKNNSALVEFSVKDTGIGIAADKIGAIFKPFEQENNSISRKFGGTGLGLSISNSIVNLFGGQIELESKLGEGSTFSFKIWMAETMDKAEIEEDISIEDRSGRLKGKKMLLVDDVEINRTIVISMLEETGLEIDEASDGEMAVNIFKDSAVGEYDIILMDIQMPKVNGYEASQSIRGLERSDSPDIPIVALTANAFKDDIDRAISYGMNAHIAKPVEMDMLLKVVFKFLLK